MRTRRGPPCLSAGSIHVDGAGVGVGGGAPAVALPGAAERGEHPVGRAVGLGHPAGRDGVGRARAHERATVAGERLLDGLVPGPPVRAEVGRDVHLRRVDRGGDPRHDVGRVAADDEQPAVEALVERAQAAVEHGPPRRPGRAEQGRVQHEQREPAPARRPRRRGTSPGRARAGRGGTRRRRCRRRASRLGAHGATLAAPPPPARRPLSRANAAYAVRPPCQRRDATSETVGAQRSVIGT